jgi:predicted double-glycine peptidase
MFNVIRNEYKNNKYIYDPELKNYKIDYAFFVIRNFPYLLNRKYIIKSE